MHIVFLLKHYYNLIMTKLYDMLCEKKIQIKYIYIYIKSIIIN